MDVVKHRNDETPLERIARIADVHKVRLDPNLVVDSAEATWTAVPPPGVTVDADQPATRSTESD